MSRRILSEIERGRKVLIGVVHLPPLPGSPRASLSVEEIVERAISDCEKLYEAGFDGAIIENYGDHPYSERASKLTVAAMSVIAREVVKSVPLPIGINVLRNDYEASLSIAEISGAEFVRINVYSEVAVSSEGVLRGVARDVQEFLEKLSSRPWILADIRVKHSTPLYTQDLDLLAEETERRCLADAIALTGSSTGRAPSLRDVARAKLSVSIPVFVASGIRESNILRYLAISDGVVVGTAIKRGGITENEIDGERARKLVEIARREYP